MKNIKTVGVVGAGTMGAALAQKFAQEGFHVILADREHRFVEKGLTGIKSMLHEGVERKVFAPEQADSIVSNITGTINLADLKNCDIIIEAIFENFEAKSELFKTLSEIVPADAILATNTSSFSVTELAASVKNPERFIGLHYFYHAAKNRLVEIIPGAKTSEQTTKAAYRFSIMTGKDPIYTKDAYGFAVNRFFVPWLNESVKILEEGVASAAEIDTICMKTFGIGMGPFALMNATGVPVSFHAQKTLEHFGASYKVAALLEQQALSNNNWSVGDMEQINISPEKEKIVADRILGCVMFVCTQILQEKICTPADLNRGAKIGLRWRQGPVDLMNKMGTEEVMRLIENYAARYKENIPEAINVENLKMEFVQLEINDNVAVITMSHPEDMNALNEEVIKQLNEKFTEANNNAAVNTIILTATGKAFVAGADIKFFVQNIKNNSLDKILSFTQYGQQVYEAIDKSEKLVIALLNGMTLGGGMELALCADYIFALSKATMAFPETGIGIYPGLGGTQRTTKRIGKALAKYLILTGKMLTAAEAVHIGLIDGVINYDQLFGMLEGNIPIPKKTSIQLDEKWKAIEHLYSKNNVRNIIIGNYNNGFIEPQEVEKISAAMKRKAPIALNIAEQLIEEEKGTQSELEKLKQVFATKDALLGLTSIGKKVTFTGE